MQSDDVASTNESPRPPITLFARVRLWLSQLRSPAPAQDTSEPSHIDAGRFAGAEAPLRDGEDEAALRESLRWFQQRTVPVAEEAEANDSVDDDGTVAAEAVAADVGPHAPEPAVASDPEADADVDAEEETPPSLLEPRPMDDLDRVLASDDALPQTIAQTAVDIVRRPSPEHLAQAARFDAMLRELHEGSAEVLEAAQHADLLSQAHVLLRERAPDQVDALRRIEEAYVSHERFAREAATRLHQVVQAGAPSPHSLQTIGAVALTPSDAPAAADRSSAAHESQTARAADEVRDEMLAALPGTAAQLSERLGVEPRVLGERMEELRSADLARQESSGVWVRVESGPSASSTDDDPA